MAHDPRQGCIDPNGPARAAQFTAANCPEIASQEARRNEEVRLSEITKQICEAYPRRGEPVRIKMKNSGQYLLIGYQHALQSIAAGWADLVIPED